MIQSSQRDIQTPVLVLQRVPYIGNKQIVTCLSPQLGRMSFFVRGSESARRTQGQPFDLFRVLDVTCHRNSGDLFYPDSVEITSDFSSLSRDYAAYDTACRLLKFAARNTQPDLAAEGFYRALVVALKRLQDGELLPDAAITGCCLAFLYEAGALDYGHADDKELNQQKILVDMSQGGTIPVLAPETWRRLREWTEAILNQADFLFE